MSPLSRRQALGSLAAWTACAPAAISSAAAGGRRTVPYYSARSELFATLACARMALSNASPEEHYPVEDVSEMVFHRPGKWIFEAQLVPIMIEKNLEALLYSETPHEELVAGKFPARHGPAAPERIDREAVAWAAGYLNEKNFTAEGADLEKALDLFRKGWFVIAGVDARALWKRRSGAAFERYDVVVAGEDSGAGRVLVHDPCRGPSVSVSARLLSEAMSAGGADRTVLAIRAPETEDAAVR